MAETGTTSRRHRAAAGGAKKSSRRKAPIREPNMREKHSSPPDFFAGSGEMGVRIRAFDWSQSPVGPVDAWPQSLKTAVSICLGSRYPIVIWWGRQAFTQFYNDAYISFLGASKHPDFLGKSGRECWNEIWHIMGPMWESVFEIGEATWSEDFLYVIARNLPREEICVTLSYSPIQGDSGAVDGIFCACYETTGRVIGERRLKTLRDLGRSVMESKTTEEACEVAARTLARNPHDLPFALIYLLDGAARHARPVATSGLEVDGAAAPERIDLQEVTDGLATWPLQKAFDSGTADLNSDLTQRFGPLPGGPWPESPEAGLIIPIAVPGQTHPMGFVIAGLSPRQIFDADYRSFLDLVAGHVGAAITNACAYENERKRADALAEIDRAKTQFFSNVSYEFRTPLTLMLGPLEDALASSNLPPAERERLDVAHRNSLRLLKLVNFLLDFSRIEAGRAQANYEPVDLAALTALLTSNFRSACERAGLKLVIDCPPLPEPLYVDREMWQKIALNLLSNALKFTFEGEIAVRLRADSRGAVLTVRDTGVGIPQPELPRLFEHFHRIEGQRSRSYEGSGIGLALIRELVKLHGGAIRAESAIDHGATFTIILPFGTAHLPPDRIRAESSLASTAVRTDAYVQEALRWLPDDSTMLFDGPSDEIETPDAVSALRRGLRILFADDNADMRAYVRRLFERHCAVETVGDGEAALAAIRERHPDLVLADVMMPSLDGFGLLRAIRADPALRALPVILLSARAGEESRIQGLEAGADDYLTKPFAARELIVRVDTNLQTARMRREAGEALRHANSELGQRLAELQTANLEIQGARRAALNVMEDAVLSRQAMETLNEQLQEGETRKQLLINELNHGVKNMLATVQSIAAQTFRAADLDSSVREKFEARLVALSSAHSVLTEESWEGAEIHDILARTLEPHADPERLQMQGPPIRLSPKAALAISMGMHELATNAVKYGALSNGSGRIAVTWTVDGPEPGTLNLRWTETGGPVVSAPARKGFGSRLIERNLSFDLDGEARIDYRPEGVVCTIVSPLE